MIDNTHSSVSVFFIFVSHLLSTNITNNLRKQLLVRYFEPKTRKIFHFVLFEEIIIVFSQCESVASAKSLMLVRDCLEEARSFLEELNSLLEVRMRFSKLPLRIRLRWSSAGRVLVEC